MLETGDSAVLPLLAFCTGQSPGFPPEFLLFVSLSVWFLQLQCLSQCSLHSQGRCLPWSLTFTCVFFLAILSSSAAFCGGNLQSSSPQSDPRLCAPGLPFSLLSSSFHLLTMSETNPSIQKSYSVMSAVFPVSPSFIHLPVSQAWDSPCVLTFSVLPEHPHSISG